MGAFLYGTGRNLCLSVASLACFFVALEFGIRLLDPQPAIRYRFSPHTYYEPVPETDFVYSRKEFSVPVAYNAFGMRDRPRSIDRPDGGIRIALLGDSFVEAKEVFFEDTLGQVLEGLLAKRFPCRSVEVLNFGVGGFGTVASAIRFQKLGARFRPDVVIYVFVDNDPMDNTGNEAKLYTIQDGRMEFRPVLLNPVGRAGRTLLDFLKQNLQTYSFLRWRLGQIVSGEWNTEVPFPKNQDDRVETPLPDQDWVATRLAVERLREIVHEAGATLWVAAATTSGPDMTERVSEICTELGLRFLDLAAVLDQSPVPVYYRYDGHWRPEGHARAARLLDAALASFLEARGFSCAPFTSIPEKRGAFRTAARPLPRALPCLQDRLQLVEGERLEFWIRPRWRSPIGYPPHGIW